MQYALPLSKVTHRQFYYHHTYYHIPSNIRVCVWRANACWVCDCVVEEDPPLVNDVGYCPPSETYGYYHNQQAGRGDIRIADCQRALIANTNFKEPKTIQM